MSTAGPTSACPSNGGGAHLWTFRKDEQAFCSNCKALLDPNLKDSIGDTPEKDFYGVNTPAVTKAHLKQLMLESRDLLTALSEARDSEYWFSENLSRLTNLNDTLTVLEKTYGKS